MTANYDAIVVGSGAGGAAAAWRLCEQGLQVLLLEAGPRFDPQSDYKLHRPDWERHPFPQPAGSRGAFLIGKLDRLNPDYEDLRSWNKAVGQTVRTDRREPMGPGYSHVQGVGGSTLHFVGEAHRLHPQAMQMQQYFGQGADWPLSYPDLEPYYALAEQLVGVAGPNAQAARWRSGPYPLPPHPLSPAAELLSKSGARLGMQWQANSRAALSRPYDGRPACNYCSNCSRGCPLGDKGSADVTFIRKAQQSGRLTLHSGCQVTGISLGKSGRIDAISYVRDGVEQRQATPLLLLACGAVQTPRLLLASRSSEMPHGLANSSGQVGRNFMESLFWVSTGIAPGLRNSHVGLPADAICWDFNAPNAIDGLVGGCRFSSGVQESGLNGPIAYAQRVVGGFGKALKDGVRQQFGHAVTVGAMGEFLPNEQTFIDLDWNDSDRFGIPKPRLHSHLAKGELERLRFMASTSRALIKEAGAELVEEYGAYDNFAATHVFGTCRMGNDSESSVVNADCRSHDHENLYITDASVFPSTGGGESPSLTIQAVTMRAVDKLLGKPA